MSDTELSFKMCGRLDPPPADVEDVVLSWVYLPKRVPDLIQKLPGALVVFVFRGPVVEYWRFDVADGWPAPLDVLVRSVARYGEEPTAVLVAWLEVFGDDRKSVRIRVTAEHADRREALTQVLDVGTDTVGPLTPGEGGEVVGPTWLGEGPTLDFELVGYPGMRDVAAEA